MIVICTYDREELFKLRGPGKCLYANAKSPDARRGMGSRADRLIFFFFLSLFIYDCAGSLLCGLFFSCSGFSLEKVGFSLVCGVQASLVAEHRL